jgi:hypothetical protein
MVVKDAIDAIERLQTSNVVNDSQKSNAIEEV